MLKRALSKGVLVLAGSFLFITSAPAQEWKPAGTIALNTSTQGGSADTIGRLLGPRLGERLGVPVIIEYQRTSAGTAAFQRVARSAPDGRTIMFASAATAAQAAVRDDLGFDLLKDFSMLGMLVSYPFVVMVRPESSIQNIADLIKEAKARPGHVTFTRLGVGSFHHLLGEWIALEGGVSMQAIPYRGVPDAMTDVRAGRVDLLIAPAANASGFIQNGLMRAIGISSDKRHPLLPDVSPIAETLPTIYAESWLGLLAPATTPPVIVARLNAEMRAVLALPEVRALLFKLGNAPDPSTPEQMRARVVREMAIWKRIVDAKGIKIE